MEKILVPIDFSDRSREALGRADELAVAQGGELELMYVQASTQLSFMDFTYVTPPDILAEALAKAQAHLEQWSQDLKTPRDRVACTVLVGDTVDTLLARSTKADLIVISTHGRKGLAHAVMGSVAERLVQRAACSVLVVR